MTDLYDIGAVEQAIYQKLQRDPTLYNLVNKKIYTGLEKQDVPSRLTSDNEALISINYSDDISTPFHGSASNHMGSVKGFIQVDVASRKNKSLVRQCIASINRLLYNNVEITVGPRTFNLVVDDLLSKVSYDESLSAFRGAVRVQIYYEALFE